MEEMESLMIPKANLIRNSSIQKRRYGFNVTSFLMKTRYGSTQKLFRRTTFALLFLHAIIPSNICFFHNSRVPSLPWIYLDKYNVKDFANILESVQRGSWRTVTLKYFTKEGNKKEITVNRM